MNNIKQTTNGIVFENNYATITISKTAALVESIIDKKSGADIKRDATKFF